MRRSVLAATVVLLAGSIASAPTALAVREAPAGQSQRASISLSAPRVVEAHSRLAMTGHTSAPRGAVVRIYQRPQTRSSWNLEGTSRVGRWGSFRYAEGVTVFDRYYRACVGSSCSNAVLVEVAIN